MLVHRLLRNVMSSGTGRALCAVGALPVFVVSPVLLLSASSAADTQPRMGDPLPGLTTEQMDRFLQGRTDYDTPLLEADGLGPIFNKESCGNCHSNPLGGPGSQTVTRFGTFNKKGGFDPMVEWGGSLHQAVAIDEDCADTHPSEIGATVIELRVTNGMMGYGLVEAIDDADLLANEDPFDADADGVSGVAHMVEAFEAPGVPRVGRFGWKAQVPTILTFSADAALNEMGLTNRFLMEENDPNGIFPPAIEDCDTVADPEDGPDKNGFDFIDRVTHFQRYLAQPPQTPKSGMTGEVLFDQVGCTKCHVAQFTTKDEVGLEDALRNKVIRPYSDFLLHDMGLTGDPIVQGGATERTVRTAPLWGLRDREPLLHNASANSGTFDGRISQVIAHHADSFSEASNSANAYLALTSGEQAQVRAFMASLGRVEFDTDGDAEIQLDDFHGFGSADALEQCFGQVGLTPDDACSVHDIDQDGDVDLDDYDEFILVFDGALRDCNGNGIVDLEDILTGVLADVDTNGVPDDCEPTCAGDLNGSGDVNVADILALLAGWGPCPGAPSPCNADINLDQIVDVADLLAALAAWGGC